VATQHVEMVAVDREVWSGDAEAVNARTLEGEIGILANHAPLLAVLAEGYAVRIVAEGGEEMSFAAHGGFLQVSNNEVQVLVERAEPADEIDVERARRALESHADAAEDDAEGQAAYRRAQARLRAAGESV
jgi:F-type H+-transporting ATPase subunit epsilon